MLENFQIAKNCRAVQSGYEKGPYVINSRYATLFASLNKIGLSWCSWKSNEHLHEGLIGKTDVDILFRFQDRLLVEQVMEQSGFILFQAPPHKYYPGIYDFIFFDPENNVLLHAHSHFLLTLGETGVKSFVFPWNEKILADKCSLEFSGQKIYAASPEDELILLLVREAIKNGGGKDDGFKKELSWLKERASPQKVHDSAATFLDEPAAAIIRDMLVKDVSVQRLFRLRYHVLTHAAKKKWRRMSNTDVFICRAVTRVVSIATKLAEKIGLSQTVIPRRRTLSGEGVIIALIGPDGSGKTSLIKRLHSMYSIKIDVARLYFGNGDSGKSFLRFCLSLLSKIVQYSRKIFDKTADKSAGIKSPQRTSGKHLSVLILVAVLGAFRKKATMKRAFRLKKRGYVVLCDRWPQNQVMGINDGPLLSGLKNSSSILLRKLALWESNVFDGLCRQFKPDLLLRLRPSLDTAIGRKEENRLFYDDIFRKIKAFDALRFDAMPNHDVIDANGSFDEVFRDVCHKIAQSISARKRKKPRFYECVGLPGSGKTTFCEALYSAEEIQSARSIFSSVAIRRWHIKNLRPFVTSIWDSPWLYVRLGIFLLTTPACLRPQALSFLLRLPVQKGKILDVEGAQKFLLEQLLLQNLWSGLVSAGIVSVPCLRLAPLLASMYRGLDVVILFFNLSPEEAAQRIGERKNGKSRFDMLSEEELVREMKKNGGLMEDVVKSAILAGIDVVQFDARQSVSSLLSEGRSLIANESNV